MRSLIRGKSPKPPSTKRSSSDGTSMTAASTATHGGNDEVIDYAYGRDADLYEDVLRVSRTASSAEIQSAFFDRRYELYDALAKETPTAEERHLTERRMDAVVAAFRILSNPRSREEYDARTGGKGGSKPKKKGRKKKKGAAGGKSAVAAGGGALATVGATGTRGPTTTTTPPSALKHSTRGVVGAEKQEAEQRSAQTASTRPETDDELEEILDEERGGIPNVGSGLSSDYDETAEVRMDEDEVRGGSGGAKGSKSVYSGMSKSIGSGGRRKSKKPHQHQQQRSGPSRSSTRSPRGHPTDDDSDDDITVRTMGTNVPLDEVEVAGCSALRPFDLCTRPRRVGLAIKEEVFGAAADTTSAFDQVLNVFTLRGSDINAVVSEIDQAKRCLRPGASGMRKSKSKSRRRK